MDQSLQPVQPSLQPPINTNNTTPKVFTPQQQVVNPGDGKNYTIKQQVPGKGVTVIDPTTQQELAISEQDSYNLEPALKTSHYNNIEDIAREIVADLTGDILPKQPKKEFSIGNKAMHEKTARWRQTRASLVTRNEMFRKEQSETPTYNESRQDQFLRANAGFKPYKGEADEQGHDKKTGLPMGETKKINVGLTEFPYGVDKDKNPEGYGKGTFEEMDNNFENDHEHFRNEKLLPQQTMTREESNDYLEGSEKRKRINKEIADSEKPRYSRPATFSSIADEIYKEASDEDITKLPVQYKDVKKAPGKDMGYVEPNILENANPNIQTAIKMFKETQDTINSIQATIKEKTEPLQKAILDATGGLQADLAKNAALLKTCLDMLHDELSKTSDKVSVFEDSIYTALDREKASAPAASLAAILKKAEEVNPKLVEEINKIKATIESDNTKLVLEQFVYKYPISEVQKKKVSAAFEEDGSIDQVVEELKNEVRSLILLNNEL